MMSDQIPDEVIEEAAKAISANGFGEPWGEADELDRAAMLGEARFVAPIIARWARKQALAEAIQAHRHLHEAYGSTSACHGGIGGMTVTSHCGEVCDNPTHDDAKAAWEAIEAEYFKLAAETEGEK